MYFLSMLDKQSKGMLYYFCTEVQVDFDEIRIGVVWSKDSYLLKFRTVTKLHTSGMPQGENITLKFGGLSWNYPAKSFIGSLRGVWVRGLVYQVFFIQAFGVFFVCFLGSGSRFRKLCLILG